MNDKWMSLMSKAIVILLAVIFSGEILALNIPSSQRSSRAMERVTPVLKMELSKKGLDLGSPIFMRIFKKTGELEVWVGNKKGIFSHFKTYNICTFSGDLGPKQKTGDEQAPEGFYFVNLGRLNPWSSYHLSFNLGYPNKYDRAHKRTGGALMVHGNCVSIGCYAMTNKFIEEIYTLAHHALVKGQPFYRVHVFPFRLTDNNLKEYEENRWYGFWQNLKEGYDFFEEKKVPPNVEVRNLKYIFNDS